MEVVHYNRTNNVPIYNGCMTGTMQWDMQYYRGIGFGKFRAWRDDLPPRAKAAARQESTLATLLR